MKLHHLGFACIALGNEPYVPASGPRFSISLPRVMNILEYCASRKIQMYRLSSDLVDWRKIPDQEAEFQENAELIKNIGAFARSQGIRLSSHPGQFVNLGSPDPHVVQNSLDEVAWQAHLHEMMENNRRCLVVHGGGMYGDPVETSKRLVTVLNGLPEEIHSRLCLENDERSWCIEQLLPISKATGIPLIFDNLHHSLNPGTLSREEGLETALNTWNDDIPKMHYSEQAPDKRPGSHSEYLDPEKVRYYLTMDRSFDIMLECKAKDLALLRVREALGYKEDA